MKKRILSLLLTAALALALVVPAAAYNAQNLVPQKRTYTTAFTDTQGTWCDDAVRTCYEAGLLDGKSAARFAPKDPLTYAQITVITARLHELLRGGDGKFDAPAPGRAWYQPAADYLAQQVDDTTEAGAYLLEDLYSLDYYAQMTCDRFDFVWYLAAILPESALSPINTITALPDVTDGDILRFYNAGILTGSDDYGTFNGSGDLNRGQAAAMLARIIDPSQRVKFTPKAFVASQVYLGLAPEATVLTADGYAVSAELYAYCLLSNISAMEMENYFSFYETYPEEFNAYLQDMEFTGDFGDYLLEKKGIDVNAPMDWDTPDKGGMSPAQKVREDTLTAVTKMAVLMNRQKEYPLTAQQKADLSGYLEEAAGAYYGFSRSFVEQMLTASFLAENLTASFSLTPGQLEDYLEESGYIYGQYVVIYRGEEGWYGSDSEAKAAAETVRQQMNAHRGDAEYLEYLIWKYSDDYTTEADLVPLGELSLQNRQALARLGSGQVSQVLVEDDRYLVVMKLDPSQDEELSQSIATIPADAQIAKWAEDASVTLSGAYNAISVSQVAAAYDAFNR